MQRLRPHPALIALALLGIAAAGPAHADKRGRAYGLYAFLPANGISPTLHCDSGWLDRAIGGTRSSYKANVNYGSTMYVQSMECESRGDGCHGHDESHLEAGCLFKGSPFEVTWSHMDAADDDTCCRNQGDRSSRFTGLTFGGRPVTVTGRPNQVLSVTGQATLILNESTHEHDDDDECDDDGEHVTLHLILKNGGEVKLGCLDLHRDDLCCRAVSVHHSTWGGVKAVYR